MIRPPSIQKQYDEFFAGDPAFVQRPSKPEGTAATELAIKEWEKAAEDYDAKLRTARETGDWSALRVNATEQPTKFVMQIVSSDVYRHAIDMLSAEQIGRATFVALLVRACCTSIHEIAGIVERDFKPAIDPMYPRLGKLAPQSLIEKLDQADISIVGELAAGIQRRLEGLSPK